MGKPIYVLNYRLKTTDYNGADRLAIAKRPATDKNVALLQSLFARLVQLLTFEHARAQ